MNQYTQHNWPSLHDLLSGVFKMKRRFNFISSALIKKCINFMFDVKLL